MNNFNLTKMATQMFFPGNVAQLDDAGLPSILVYIPKFKNSDVLNGGDDSTHPAFIVNGKEVPGFYYSKYQNVVHNGAAYSLPAEDPRNFINFDEALKACESKGHGWHLCTAAEWAAIALWCKANGFLPYGNNFYGMDGRENTYKAVPTSYGNDGRVAHVATGTGPKTWSHDNSMAGIWDMNGNLWEWQGGLRLVWGELQLLANNDAADLDNPQNETSTCWKAINAADGSLVVPECKTTDATATLSGNTVRLDFVDNKWTYCTSITNAANTYRNSAFYLTACTNEIGDAAKQLLRALALLPDEGTDATDYESDQVYWNNSRPERCVARGGYCAQGTGAGMFSLYGPAERAGSNINVGFRAAYIPDIIE